MYGARRFLMLEGDSLILLDVMKLDFITCFILSRQSFNQACHLGFVICMCIFFVTSTVFLIVVSFLFY